ncbi:MAG: hypothetical protein ACFE9L_12945 [Candidatus Hodarchaeota archaeon]
MKKNLKSFDLFVLAILSIQLVFMPKISSSTGFINSFWNTLGFGENTVLKDWSEAGKEDFLVLGFTGTLYIKNDYSFFYLGVLILGEIGENLTWRLNFDVDADSKWAEDCKELTIFVISGDLSFNYQDRHYIQNNPVPYNDSFTNDFLCAYRIFSSAGNDYTIFELEIPFQTNDYYRDLQVQDPENSIIGVSMDVFKLDLAQNGTWKGGQYPNYANASSYEQILFAGPQDRRIPIFEEEIPPTTSEIPSTTTTEPPPADYREGAGAAGSFESWVGFLALFVTVFTVRKIQKRNCQ